MGVFRAVVVSEPPQRLVPSMKANFLRCAVKRGQLLTAAACSLRGSTSLELQAFGNVDACNAVRCALVLGGCPVPPSLLAASLEGPSKQGTVDR